MIVKPIMEAGYNITYKILDRGLIEELGPSGVVRVVGRLTQESSKIQTGQIYQYCLVMIAGTIVMILYGSA